MNNETLTWYSCAMKFYQDGKTHVPYMDGVFSTLDPNNLEFGFSNLLNSYYKPTRYIEAENKFIYEGVRVEITPETEAEFEEVEQSRKEFEATDRLLEIWCYSFKINTSE
ncbi:hypothetical protein ACE1AT_06130 [Pelatocladus sp. BLCC-F211]|uniref:hypothetical protein n=1 Tax=Pelatocladus sp. BLCC-F211 TaxID=3342752 RepID=UPI0035B783EC